MDEHDKILQDIQHEINQLRPAIINDGGDIEVVGFKLGIVYIRLLGACVQCPISQITLKIGVEETLKSKIPSILEVVRVD